MSSLLHIELLAIKQGIKLLQGMENVQAVVEGDCLLVVQAITT